MDGRRASASARGDGKGERSSSCNACCTIWILALLSLCCRAWPAHRARGAVRSTPARDVFVATPSTAIHTLHSLLLPCSTRMRCIYASFSAKSSFSDLMTRSVRSTWVPVAIPCGLAWSNVLRATANQRQPPVTHSTLHLITRQSTKQNGGLTRGTSSCGPLASPPPGTAASPPPPPARARGASRSWTARDPESA